MEDGVKMNHKNDDLIWFVFKIRLRNCDKVFHPNLEPGVLVQQEAGFEDSGSTILALMLLQQKDRMMKEYIEVVIEAKGQREAKDGC
jgi:hypothetical protein